MEDRSADKGQTRLILHNKAAWQVEAYSETQRSLQLPAMDCSGTQAHSRQELPVEVYSVPPIPSNRIRLAAAVCSEETRELRLKLKQNHFLASPQPLLQELVFCKHQLSRPVYNMWFADLLYSGSTQNAQQQQQQQQQKPTLSVFGSQNTTTQQPQVAAAAQGTVVQGVRIDASNLLPTTKFESCADEIKRTIEQIDAYILNQISMCNDVAGIIPTVVSQGSTIPNDVEFVEGKLETIQLALENDAREIDAVRNMVARNAAEAQIGFRAIDNLKLPLQYQSTGGGWWSVSEQQLSERQTLRSSIKNRKSTLALPDDVEGDPSTSDSINGIPTNLVEYFSHRSDEMSTVLDGYRKNLKEIEDHLHGVEGSLNRQINEFLSSRNRDDGTPGGGGAKNQLADLAAALGDVEAGILGVASRLGGVKEEVQELILGPPTLGMGRLG